MNGREHIMTCLAEEGSEVTKCVTKILRFGAHDRNFLNPEGPTNLELLVDELNDVLGVAGMLVERGLLPHDWQSEAKQAAKKVKVLSCMEYARKHGALKDDYGGQN